MKKAIASKLKELRNDLNYSTEYVSNALKQMGFSISPNTLYNYENGISQPKADMFLCLCKIYNVTTFDVFFDEAGIATNKTAYDTLNDIGKQKADDYIKDLNENPKYTEKKKINRSVFDFDTAIDVTNTVSQIKSNKNKITSMD